MLYLEHLFQPFGLDLTAEKKRVKLVRHLDKRLDVWELYREGHLQDYQALQSKPVFDGCDVLLSFLGLPSNHAAFVGVYRVEGWSTASRIKLPENSPVRAIHTAEDLHYKLTLDQRFAALHDRVVIDWGKGALAWVQHFRPQSKAIVEVLPAGYVREFPGYLNVTLTFTELAQIVRHPVANREWHRMLRAVAGIYLILDRQTGSQYVGSAYGSEGILGRWTSYIKNGHGGNKQLKGLLVSRPKAAHDFQFSVLQTLPLTLTPREVIEYEQLHKRKLGSRAHGLNSN